MQADFSEEILRLSPTKETSLGLDSGARSSLKSRLQDDAPADDSAWAAQVQSMLTRMGTLQPDQLSADAQIRYDSVRYAATEGVDGLRFS